MFPTRWLPAAIAVLCVTASGCAERLVPQAVEMGFRHPVWTDDGLYLVERGGPGALFLASAPLQLDRYDRVLVEEIQLGFKPGVREIASREQNRLTAMVRRNALRRLAPFGLRDAQGAGPGTLRMRISITQIDYRGAAYLRGATSLAVQPSGGARIAVELRDSVDDRRLLVYAQHRQLPFANYGGPGRVEAYRVADAFYEYAEDLARTVAQAERGDVARPRSHARLSRDANANANAK